MNEYLNENIDGASQAIETFHSKEYITFISQVGFAQPGQFKVLLHATHNLESNNRQLRPILIAGRAKIASLEGDFHEASFSIKQALEEAELEYKSSKDRVAASVLAYVHYEYGLFFNLLESSDLSLQHFKYAKRLTSSSKLLSLLDFQFELHDINLKKKTNLKRLDRLVKKFKSQNQVTMYVLGLHRMGVISHNWQHYSDSEKYLREALSLAEEGDYKYLIWTIKNDLGLLLHKQKKYQDSISHFEGFIDSVESHYLKAIVMKSLAIRYQLNRREADALELAKDGLEYAQIHNVFSVIPTYAWLIGDQIVAGSANSQEAFHYYKLGYEESMKQQKAGLPLTGQRLRAVQKYSEYVTSQLPESFNNITVANYFEWAKGKSWVKIQDLFHYNFFVYHFIHTGIGQKTFKHLDMISTTFYSLAKRMRDLRGIAFPDLKDADMTLPPDLYIDSLQRYVQLHRDKTFKQANAQFEHDIYEYLFKESGYNKKLLSRSLDLSYSVVLKNTKQFTQASETFTRPQLEAPR